MTVSEKNKKTNRFKNIWRKVRTPLAQSYVIKACLVGMITFYLRLVYWTNPRLKSSDDPRLAHQKYNPFIITFWHGLHIMGPFLRPTGETIVAMFSRSSDAELNARVSENLGLKVVRGSGGRGGHDVNKGGARALLTLKNTLKQGNSAAIIADISHSTAREAGKGIILLAKLSGRPIVPYSYAFSREKILHKTWDKTALPLPFGRSVFLYGEALCVPKDADEDMLEQKRMELTTMMNALTDKAYRLLEQRS